MNDNIIMLEDMDGNTIEFETVDVFEFGKETYFAMAEVMPEGEETDEILIMKVIGEGDDIDLISVDDDDELDAAFAEFTRRMDEMSE